MTYTILVKLVGFRLWTESLGYDREWLIQLTQTSIYHELQALSKDFNGYALPLRYDVQVVILPIDAGVSKFLSDVKNSLSSKSPVPVSVEAYCGLPHEVLNNGFNVVCQPRDLCVAHIDLNDFTAKTDHRGIYQPYVEVLKLVSELASKLSSNAIVQYLGGDNIVALTDPKYVNLLIDNVLNYDVKLGIGMSRYPRKAFELATKALDSLRSSNRSVKFLVFKE